MPFNLPPGGACLTPKAVQIANRTCQQKPAPVTSTQARESALRLLLRFVPPCFVGFEANRDKNGRHERIRRSRTYKIVEFSELPVLGCPCGDHSARLRRRRRITGHDSPYARISEDAAPLSQEADGDVLFPRMRSQCDYAALDDEIVPVPRAGMCIMIPPGVRHRAIGKMTVLNVVVPKFDPADEWID